MPTCPVCGLENVAVPVCTHHSAGAGEDWHVSNRIWCAFFHRGIVPERLPASERDEDFWAIVDPGTQVTPDVADAA